MRNNECSSTTELMKARLHPIDLTCDGIEQILSFALTLTSDVLLRVSFELDACFEKVQHISQHQRYMG